MRLFIALLFLLPNLVLADKVIYGFYMGTQSGYIHLDADQAGDDGGLGGGLYFGAGKVLADNVYLTLEGEVYATGNEIVDAIIPYERGTSLGFHIKAASPSFDQVMPYSKLGIVSTEMDLADSADDWEVAASFALGFEMPIVKPWAVRIEAGYLEYLGDVFDGVSELHAKLGLTHFF